MPPSSAVLSSIPEAAPWSIAVGDAGRWAVLVGIVTFLLAFGLTLFPKESVNRLAGAAFWVGVGAIAVSLGSLVTLFVTDQFQYQYVFGHSEARNAIQYKVASVWSGQQGSFLLWAVTSALFAGLALKGTGPYRRGYLATCSLFLAALCGILSYESPFILNLIEGKALIPPDGRGLTPALYNYWVVIHPPTIFFGFGSLVILFAYAVSALANRDYNDWISRVRPWVIASTTLIGLGLCMGGFWAYEMLGWGGFWMWDPVENASFVPWVLGAALIHGMLVQTTRKKWHFTNLLLAGLPFLAFCYGTFLTRSGFMADVSVHSFATMESNALRLLKILLIGSSVGFLAFWGFRLATQPKLAETEEARGYKRESFYQLGMVILGLMALATAIGMSVPLYQAIRGEEGKVVEELIYNRVMSWFFVPLMLLMGLAPFVSWRAMPAKELFGRVVNTISATLFLTGLSIWVLRHPEFGVRPDLSLVQPLPGPLGAVNQFAWFGFLIGLCWFVAIAHLWRLAESLRGSKLGWGGFLSHVGLAVAMAGLIISRGFERKQTYILQPGSTAIGFESNGPRHFIDLLRNEPMDFANRDNTVPLRMYGDGPEFIARPGLYYDFPPNDEPRPQVWPFIKHLGSHDIYVVLHPLMPETGVTVNLKPGETREVELPIWSTISEATYRVTYEKLVREGEAGMRGTQFGAQLLITNGSTQKRVTPKMVVQGQPLNAQIDHEFHAVLKSMDAATQSVEIGFNYVMPVFPIDTFYKPMTVLVWVGVGIMTGGGFMSAIYRRRIHKKTSSGALISEPLRTNENKEDAPVPVA